MGTLDEYLAAFGPMRAGALRKALTRVQRFGGRCYKRHVYAEVLATGSPIVIDTVKRRVYTDPERGIFYEFSDVTLAFVGYLTWLVRGVGK